MTGRRTCHTLYDSIRWRAKSCEAEQSMLVAFKKRGVECDILNSAVVCRWRYSYCRIQTLQ